MGDKSDSIVVGSVSRDTLSKQVVNRIIQLLLDGQLKPGDKLPSEMDLIEQLEVSRPVLREALSSLETMEVIRRKTRDGTYFNHKIGSQPFRVMLALSIDNLPAIIEARMTLELGLVTMAAEKISESQLKKLKASIDAMSERTDDNYGHLDRKFHYLIADSANNPILEGMIDSLLKTHERTDQLIKYRERELTVEHHLAIYDALANHDPHKAFSAMYQHLSYVRQKILGKQKQS